MNPDGSISPADMNCYFCMNGECIVQVVNKMGDRIESVMTVRFDICADCARKGHQLSPIAHEISAHAYEHMKILEDEIRKQMA